MKWAEDKLKLVADKDFYELKAAELWGANIDVGGSISVFKDALIQAAKKSCKNYFGYFFNSKDGKTKYHLSRYPRRKYGPIPDDVILNMQLKTVLDFLDTLGQVEQFFSEPMFRVVMGLELGYGSGKFFTVEDVMSILGNNFDLMPVEIFTVKIVDCELITYQEPALVIKGMKEDAWRVYILAEKLGQERFTFEDLENHSSCIIETKFCMSHDPE